jgi:hypothetical protein
MSKPIYLTTTGILSPVPVEDLGKIPGYVHPTTDWNIREEFRLDAIQDSDDLQAAVDAGYIILRDSVGATIRNVRAQVEAGIAIAVDGQIIIDRASVINFNSGATVTGTTGVAQVDAEGGAGFQGPEGQAGPAGVTGPASAEPGLQGATGPAGVTGVADAATVTDGLFEGIRNGSITGVPLGIGFLESVEESTETATTVFQNKLSLRWGEDADPTQRRQYRIEWYFEHTVNTASRLVQTRLRIDNQDPDIGQDIYEPSSANSYVMRSGWYEKAFAPTGPTGAVGHTISMEFRRFPGGGGGAVASIRRARIKVFDLGVAD